MESDRRTRGLMLAAAAASLFALAPLAAHADAGEGAKLGACFGVNACKGKSSCKTAHSGCKGLNGCKGQGFIEEVSPGTCAQLDGKFRTYEDVQKEQASH
jgi:uncharacterized membrane protein